MTADMTTRAPLVKNVFDRIPFCFYSTLSSSYDSIHFPDLFRVSFSPLFRGSFLLFGCLLIIVFVVKLVKIAL